VFKSQQAHNFFKMKTTRLGTPKQKVDRKREIILFIDDYGEPLCAGRYHLHIIGTSAEDGNMHVRTNEGSSSRYFSGKNMESLTCVSCGNPAIPSEFTLRASREAREKLGLMCVEVDRFRFPLCNCPQAAVDYREYHAPVDCLAHP
jgi:hypothetical protein